jgi:hypothetical protein
MATYIGANKVNAIYHGSTLLTDLYHGATQIPTSSDPLWSDVVLLLQGSTTDASNSGQTVTATNISLNSATVPYAGAPASLAFDGATSVIDVAANNSLVFPSGQEFTVEFWYYASSVTNSTYPSLFNTGAYNHAGSIGLEYSGGDLFGYVGSNYGRVSRSVAATNVWRHVAYQRNIVNGLYLVQFFINGALQSYAPIANQSLGTTTADPLSFGKIIGWSSHFQGFMSSIRITRAARYTNGSFTQPTTPFPTS